MTWQKSLEILNELKIGNNLEHLQTLTSSVTTSWGVDWDEVLIARDIMHSLPEAVRRYRESYADVLARWYGKLSVL